jgi:hypothetical protein
VNARIRLPVQRPVTRGDCASVPRPCPFASECRYGLERDDSSDRGRHARAMANREASGVSQVTCALDVAASGPLEAEQIGVLLGITQQAVARIESTAMVKMARRGRKLRGQLDE